MSFLNKIKTSFTYSSNEIFDEQVKKKIKKSSVPFKKEISEFIIENNLELDVTEDMISGAKIYTSPHDEIMYLYRAIFHDYKENIRFSCGVSFELQMSDGALNQIGDFIITHACPNNATKIIKSNENMVIILFDISKKLIQNVNLFKNFIIRSQMAFKNLMEGFYNKKIIDYFEELYQKEKEIKRKKEEIARKEEEQRKEKEIKEARKKGLSYNITYSLDPQRRLRIIQERFNNDYPYLRIGFFMVQTGHKADKEGGTISHLSSTLLLEKVRSFKGECKIKICGADTPEDLEKRFRKESGLVIKVCYNDENDKRYYISKDSKEYKMALYDINLEFKKKGYKLADIS